MTNVKPTAAQIKENLDIKLARYFGCTAAEASKDQMYKATAMTIRDILAEKRGAFKKKVNQTGAKRVYYMCMEFLLGRSLKTNLCNLGLDEEYKKALADMGFELDDLYNCEPDAGLGNGGLGRLAACFMDSLSSLDYPATGFSLCYEYGLFKQMIVDGLQVELPDVWLPGGEVWLVPRTDRSFKVRFGGRVREEWKPSGHCEIIYEDTEEIEAVPYDMMISGADSQAVSRLRLWRARDIQNFNMRLFTQGQYARAQQEATNAASITKVLYPSDNHTEGKLLRLTQQYFLCSASVQSIIRDHMAVYGTLDNLAEKVAIHLNDTHPTLCIPELMRILVDEYFYPWDVAWHMVTRICSYTNHTVLPEALETWNEDLFRLKLPRIHAIIKEINERFCREAWQTFPGNWQKISAMSVVGYGQVRMANLAVIGSHSVNGVSKLHSNILKKSVFNDFFRLYPERFDNVTNGIAHRRWLCYSNPELAKLLDETIGTGYRHNPVELAEFAKFADNDEILERFRAIKHNNKISFANHLYRKSGQKLDTHAVFDVQIKRLHEYKRQLLNALNIIGIFLDLRDNPNLDITPQTYIFGAKAAPGYHMAKRIIQLLCMISKEIERHPAIREKLNLVFLENYDVSTAEALIPSADISEQISLAGKEASGTGCMKLMMNGALTIGTLDGANVEMLAAAGEENMFIFGLTSNEVDELWARGYHSTEFYANNERLARIINALTTGFGGESFADIATYLLGGQGIADPYMCMADFESYRLTHEKAIKAYADRQRWTRMALLNTAASGHFAADRSIREYADRFWNIKPVK
ncbi:MAG: glycogen/starch/alpha-glucan phosphorylase [Ruminococcaceae bacterium]|nr:glycogen/starch/alpha-glucan phosphorylase [Oscillospiraceae bacterium]